MKEYIVITGASSGIGQALAIEFANQGCHVLAIGRNEVALQRTKRTAINDNIRILVADISEEKSLDDIVKFIGSGNRIKYLIHSAAMLEPLGPLLETNYSELKKSLLTNVVAPITLTRKLRPYFISGARVLFIGSDYVGVDNKIKPHVSGAYSMSKTALKVAVEYLRLESDEFVLIGYLNPGSTQTPMYARFWEASNKQGVVGNAVAPTNPIYVARFIREVLDHSRDEVFCSVDWDYRKLLQHDQVNCVSRRAKL